MAQLGLPSRRSCPTSLAIPHQIAAWAWTPRQHERCARPPERGPRRPLPHRAPARRGRDGDRLPGRRSEARTEGRAQGLEAGTRLVYAGAAPDGGAQLWQRALDDLEPDPIPGTEGAFSPVFSPDGLSVAFVAGANINTVSLGGGPPFTVTSNGRQPSWGSDGMIYFARLDGVYRVPETGGEPEAVPFSTDGQNRWHTALPDGQGLLFTVQGGTWGMALRPTAAVRGSARHPRRGSRALIAGRHIPAELGSKGV